MSILPWWQRWAALVLLVLSVYCKGQLDGRVHEQHERLIERGAAVQAQNTAILTRNAENDKLRAAQAATNKSITENKDAELKKTRADLAAAFERMRIPAFCNPPAGQTAAESAFGSNAADPRSGLLPEGMARRIQALIDRTEEVAATGRACQAFATQNGLIP